LGEKVSDFAATSLDEGDAHFIVSSSLMTEPRDAGGFGTLFEWNTFGAGDRAAAYGGGMSGYKIS